MTRLVLVADTMGRRPRAAHWALAIVGWAMGLAVLWAVIWACGLFLN